MSEDNRSPSSETKNHASQTGTHDLSLVIPQNPTVNQRSLRNLFGGREKQLHKTLLSSAGALLASAALVFVYLVIVLSKISNSDIFIASDKAFAVYDSVRNWGILLLAAIFALTVVSVIHTLRQTQRLAGPLSKIHQFIEDLTDGHFEARLRLRENDDTELKETAAKLNQLAQRLENRRPWSPSDPVE